MADKDSRAGARYADAAIVAYLNDTHAAHDEGLKVAFESPDADDMPAIQVGMSEGKLLELLMRMIGAQRVVEVGTLAGYSAVRLARGMKAGGTLYSIEYDQRHAEVARRNIAAASLDVTVEVLVGAGVEVLPTLVDKGPFDAVFVDADKESYDQYGAWAAANTRPGGLLIGDNSHLFGNLLEDSDRAVAMRRFHEQARDHYDTVDIPTPDGMMLGLKR